MLEMKGLTKAYPSKTRAVLSDVSASIGRGKFVSVIGPNGAGKSTLLSLVTLLMPATAGETWLDGKRVQDYERRELAKRISLLRQSNALTVRLTVKDLVSFGRFPYSAGRLMKEDKRVVEGAIERMGLEELAERYTDQLSGGERQRAFIAMTLAQNTDYILLDEPLNNLDMKHSVQIMKTLRRLVDELGKTVILVIHDINFAACYSDEILALRKGGMVGCGPTREMITESMLRAVYRMDIAVEDRDGQLVCNYFK